MATRGLPHVRFRSPKTVLELSVFLGMSLSGGFCEELVFRGYLTRQFSGWTGSRAAGILLQGVVFGLAHGQLQRRASTRNARTR